MNNNEFMNLLAVVGKNDNKKYQLIALGVLAGLALSGCCFFILKNKKINKRSNELKSENHRAKVQLVTNRAQILRLNNTIKQLSAEKEIKANNNPLNNSALPHDEAIT